MTEIVILRSVPAKCWPTIALASSKITNILRRIVQTAERFRAVRIPRQQVNAPSLLVARVCRK